MLCGILLGGTRHLRRPLKLLNDVQVFRIIAIQIPQVSPMSFSRHLRALIKVDIHWQSYRSSEFVGKVQVHADRGIPFGCSVD